MISAPQYELLLAISNGAVLMTSRVYPFPYKHQLAHGGKLGVVSTTTLSALTHRGLLKPTPRDGAWDNIENVLTDAGRQAMSTFASHNEAQAEKIAKRVATKMGEAA